MKIKDASNNIVNNNMPASCVLFFSVSIQLIDLCGSIVGVFDNAADGTSFCALISTSQQSRHIAEKLIQTQIVTLPSGTSVVLQVSQTTHVRMDVA